MAVLTRGALVAMIALAGCEASVDTTVIARPIVNGSPTSGHPAVVALVAPAIECGTADDVFCTGTLVGTRTVITAAHCLDYAPPGTLHVYFGDDATLAGSGRRVEVLAEVAHPAYDMVVHDIAILELVEDVTDVPPVRLAPALDAGTVGSQVTIVGFGSDDDGARGRKREGTSDVVSVDALVFSTTPAPSNTCVGDSGGPVLVDVAGELMLAGVTSFGDTACVQSATNTRVDVHRDDFLDDTMAMLEAFDSPGARIPLQMDTSFCARRCTTGADCPVSSACVAGMCTLHGREQGILSGSCSSASDCGSGVCAPVGDGCQCYDKCDDCDAGCSAGGGAGGWAGLFALVLLAISRRRNRPGQ